MRKNERRAPSSEQLRCFLAIAEHGNLTLAAERLFRTQSALSVQLRKLEETLGVGLFDRHARGMSLNANGEKLLPAARRALAEIERAAAIFDAPLAGRLRVGIPDDYDDTVLEGALAAFALRHPDVEIVAVSGCSSRYPEQIRKGALDLAVCSGPDSLEGAPLPSEPTLWAGAESLEIDAAKPIPLAVLDRSCWWRAMPSNALDHAGRVWRVAYKSASFPSLRAAIRAGLAIGTLPQSCLEPSMRPLGEDEGLPLLPSSNRAIQISASAPAELTRAMARAIIDAAAR